MRHFLIVLLVALSLSGGTLASANQTFTEEFNNKEFTPVDPMTSYSSTDGKATWTTWNKVLFTSAIGGQAADVISTEAALGGNCVEGNPLFGEDPNVAVMVAVKAALIGATYWYTEYYMSAHPDEVVQKTRNWAYGTLAVFGTGAAVWNSSLDCN